MNALMQMLLQFARYSNGTKYRATRALSALVIPSTLKNGKCINICGAYNFVPLSFEVDCTLRINRLIPFVSLTGPGCYTNDIDSEQKAKLNITPMLSILGPGPFISRAFSEYLLRPTILFDP